MKGKVIWSARAKINYKDILVYLTLNWTSKEIVKFTDKVEHDVSIVISHPKIGRVTKKKKIRKLVISKQTSIYYKIVEEDILVLSLFDNRQNPKKTKTIEIVYESHFICNS